jgi:predicted transcriptional regulator
MRALIETVADLLSFSTNGQKKTKIIRHCNLGYERSVNVMDFLEQRGLIEKRQERYWTTTEGKIFVEKFREIQNMMKDTSRKKNTLSNGTPDCTGIERFDWFKKQSPEQ